MVEKPNSARELKEDGLRLFQEGLYEEAIDSFEAAREMFSAEDDNLEAAEMTNNIGVIYRLQGRWDEAIAALEEAREVFVRIEDRNREAQALGNLGGLYASQGELDKALEALRQAADIFADLGDDQRHGEILLALGVQKWKAGDRGAGLAIYEAGLQTLEEATIGQRILRGLFKLRNRLLGGGTSD